jgi:ribose 5-phosphate isomerase RpiB
MGVPTHCRGTPITSSRGILICSTGIGVSIIAAKFQGEVWDPEIPGIQ